MPTPAADEIDVPAPTFAGLRDGKFTLRVLYTHRRHQTIQVGWSASDGSLHAHTIQHHDEIPVLPRGHFLFPRQTRAASQRCA